MHSSVAYISASAELRAVNVWHLETQWIGPPSHMRKPDRDRDLNNSTCWVAWCGFGAL